MYVVSLFKQKVSSYTADILIRKRVSANAKEKYGCRSIIIPVSDIVFIYFLFDISPIFSQKSKSQFL